MSEIPITDKLFLILHRAGWSVGDTAFVGKQGISWLVYGRKGDHSIREQKARARKSLGNRLVARLRRWDWFRQSDELSHPPTPVQIDFPLPVIG